MIIYQCDFCYGTIDPNHILINQYTLNIQLDKVSRLTFTINGDGSKDHICKNCIVRFLTTDKKEEPTNEPVEPTVTSDDDIPF